MTNGITFALLSLFFAGLNDVVFKRYSAKYRSRGMVIFASLLCAIYGVIFKDGLNQGADADTMLLMAASCWVVGGALYTRFREGRFRLTEKKAAYVSHSKAELAPIIVGSSPLKRGADYAVSRSNFSNNAS